MTLSPHATKATFHSTALVRDYDAAIGRLSRLIGLRVLEYSEQADPAIGRRGGMTWVGDGSLEIGEPNVPGAAPDRFVSRTGGGMHSLALWVGEFEAAAAHLEGHGATMPVRIMGGGAGFTSPRTTCGLQLEWSEFTVHEDPRLGAPLPAYAGPPLLDVAQIAFVGAVVEAPIEDARRLATLMATDVMVERPDALLGEPMAAVSLGDGALALFPLLPDRSAALWGRAHTRPQVSLLAVRVSDAAAARAALADEGVATLAERPGMIVLDPAATGDVEIAIVDELLPRDPRG